MSGYEKEIISQEEIDRTSRINMEICATFVAKMIRKYGHEVLQGIEEMKKKRLYANREIYRIRAGQFALAGFEVKIVVEK